MQLMYRCLFDGEAPAQQLIDNRLGQSCAIVRQPASACGYQSVRRLDMSDALSCDPILRLARQKYPTYWTLHFGARSCPEMAWTAIAHTFDSLQIDTIVAGADQPNAASLARDVLPWHALS